MKQHDWCGGWLMMTLVGLCLVAPCGQAQEAKERAVLKGHAKQTMGLEFSRDGKLLVSGSWDRTIKLWDVATANAVATFRADAGRVWSVTFTGDTKLLASGHDHG